MSFVHLSRHGQDFRARSIGWKWWSYSRAIDECTVFEYTVARADAQSIHDHVSTSDEHDVFEYVFLYDAPITDDAFRYLKNLQSLNMRNCNQIREEVFQHLTSLQFLNMSQCRQRTITNQAFLHLTKLRSLNMSMCRQTTIGNDAFRHLANLQSLAIRVCYQITDDAFRHLTDLRSLDIFGCTQTTNDAFRHLRNLHSLEVSYCSQVELSSYPFQHLTNLQCISHTHTKTWWWVIPRAAWRGCTGFWEQCRSHMHGMVVVMEPEELQWNFWGSIPQCQAQN